jgi:hypothetical protein
MPDPAVPNDLDPERAQLWARVQQLWSLAQSRDPEGLRAALHPGYSGWEADSPAPHDREHAIASVTGDAARLESFALFPLHVAVLDGHAGVVHYAYTARLSDGGAPRDVAGRWTEVYVREGANWLMAAVSGGPESA